MLRSFPHGIYGGGSGSVGGYHGTFTSSTSWAVNHLLGSQKLMVQCWRSSDNAIVEPNSITQVDNNNITIDWGGVAVAGTVEVINLE